MVGIRKYLPLVVAITIGLVFQMVLACDSSPTPTSGCDYRTEREVEDVADDGSKVQILEDTCVEPPPTGEKVQVESRTPGNWGLSDQELEDLEAKGQIWSMLDITPDNRTWDPAIKVWFTLKEQAPYDDFRLTIYQLRASTSEWHSAGTATAKKKGDTQALGEITHTSLFALVPEESLVVVPDLVGQGIAAASEVLADRDIRIGVIREEPAPEYEPGLIISQSLEPGSQVEPGAQLDLAVAAAAEVPDVVGMEMEQAADALHEAGFEVGQISGDQAAPEQPGTVVAQNPQGGEESAAGSHVALVVAMPTDKVLVPFVEDLILDDARRDIERAGLQVGDVREEESEKLPGVVIKQNPQGGEEQDPGASVHLVVAKVSETVVAPDVLQMDLDQALERVDAAGLRVGTVIEEPVLGQQGAMVVEQEPRGGTEVSRGSPVNLVVVIPAEGVTVPDVVGLHREHASGVITDSDLQVGGVNEEESDKEPGTVLQQRPRGGSVVEPGTEVHLLVAKPRLIPVPNVVEMYVDLAQEEIEKAGLEVGEVATEVVPGEEWGMWVLRQYPEAGTDVNPGSAVDLVVAAPEPPVIVPSVLELDLDKAAEVIEAEGLQVGTVIEEAVTGLEGNMVVDQDPKAGTEVSRGSEVDLVLYVYTEVESSITVFQGVISEGPFSPNDDSPNWHGIAVAVEKLLILPPNEFGLTGLDSAIVYWDDDLPTEVSSGLTEGDMVEVRGPLGGPVCGCSGDSCYCEIYTGTADHYVRRISRTRHLFELDSSKAAYGNDVSGSMSPDLAREWDVSEDNLVLTFYLQQGVRLVDDNDFTAQVVKQRWDDVPGWQNPGYVDEVNVIDDYTVQFIMWQYDSIVLEFLADLEFLTTD